MTARISPTSLLLLLLAWVLLATGCEPKQPKQDLFMEKWKAMAEQSKGYSPSPSTAPATEAETRVDEDKRGTQAEPRELPKVRTTLRFTKANMNAVLQAMARVADVNIMVSPEAVGEVTINVRNMPWDEVFRSILRGNGLTYEWEGNILRVLTAKDIEGEVHLAEVSTKRQALLNEKERTQSLTLHILRLKYAKADALREDLEKLLSKDPATNQTIGSIQVDKETNSLIIKGLPSDIRRIIKILNRIDLPRRQVHIQAHIVEATKETARALGLIWSAQISQKIDGKTVAFSPLFGITPNAVTSGATPGFGLPLSQGVTTSSSGTTTGSVSGLSSTGTTGSGLGLVAGSGDNFLVAELQALQEDNKVKILSSPSLTTLDNEKAATENGTRIPYVTQSTSNGTVTNTVEFIDAVLRLEIEPQVINSEYLRMKIVVKNDQPDTTRTVQGNPYITKKNTETTLIAHSGETVVISGLTKSTNSNMDRGMPGLKDVPGLGWLSKATNTDNQFQEVLIFLTPDILPENTSPAPQRTLGDIERELKDKGLGEDD